MVAHESCLGDYAISLVTTLCDMQRYIAIQNTSQNATTQHKSHIIAAYYTYIQVVLYIDSSGH